MRTESGLTRLNVVATEDELCLVGGGPTVITGEGAVNVIAALSRMDRDTPILNVGYAGSNAIPIGTRVRVGKAMLHHPNAEYDEPTFELDGDVPCRTSCDFVTETEVTEPCVFDMELAFILAMGFTDVASEKVVSDNLDMEQYHENMGR